MSGIKGSGAVLAIASAVNGAAVIPTAATNALPCVVTVTNTFTAGEIVVASAFVGMTQLNNRAFVVSPVTGANATLKGVDSTAYGAYVSGGSLQGYTMEPVGTVMDVTGFQGQPSEIKTTNLGSAAEEFLLGLQDFGTVDIMLLTASGSTDPGQAMLRTIKATQALWPFSLTLADGTVSAFMAYVKQFGFEGVNPEGVVKSKVVLRVSNAPAWFA